ncbi:hypothetical protein PFISCL1PPCAC_27991, partial [Pristionchus fissidentatus]
VATAASDRDASPPTSPTDGKRWKQDHRHVSVYSAQSMLAVSEAEVLGNEEISSVGSLSGRTEGRRRTRSETETTVNNI